MAKIPYIEMNPKEASGLGFDASLKIIKRLFGEKSIEKAFDISEAFPSPLSYKKNDKHFKTAKIIGVNPRITKTYWGIVKYAMTFPEEWVHIMPLWETGDKGSLYVQNSWDLSGEFLDEDLVKLGYDSAFKQLKLIINILHAMGKIVGFDALPHTDSFSRIVFTHPSFFEWVKLDETRTFQLEPPLIDNNLLYKEVENEIISFLDAPGNLYEMPENVRNDIIFPNGIDKEIRRLELINFIRSKGFETIPVTEHFPMRPVKFQRINKEMNCAEFDVRDKSADAKIIGCITPYRWYETDDDGYIKKDSAVDDVWFYFFEKINEFQKTFNFDFLRADMAHNQISHSYNSNVCNDDSPKEMWAELKALICRDKPYFSILAEAFYNNYYIDGITDMINKDVDIVLGNMNYKYLDEEYINWLDDFLNPFRKYFRFSPCVCIFTTDCDLEINNGYFASQKNNECRYFISLFMNLPSYMAVGYELRELFAQSECEYTNLYIKKQQTEYKFGANMQTFGFISKMRRFYIQWKNIIEECPMEFLRADNKEIIAWYYKTADKTLLFLCSMDSISTSVEFEFNFDIQSAKILYPLQTCAEFCTDKNVLRFSNIENGTCMIMELL